MSRKVTTNISNDNSDLSLAKYFPVERLTEWSWEANGLCWNWTSTTKDLMTWACHSLSWYLDDFINKTEEVIIAMLWHCYVKWGQWGVSENLIYSLSPVATVYRDYLCSWPYSQRLEHCLTMGWTQPINDSLGNEWTNEWVNKRFTRKKYLWDELLNSWQV